MKAHTGHDIASGLLRTYLGSDAGSRVHSGAVERGTVDGLRSVLWYADLRGFTRISDVSSRAAIVDMFHDTFEILTAKWSPRGVTSSNLSAMRCWRRSPSMSRTKRQPAGALST